MNREEDIKAVLARLADFYDPDAARVWLHSKHEQLGGSRPIDMIRTGRVEFVMAVLDRLSEGVYL